MNNDDQDYSKKSSDTKPNPRVSVLMPVYRQNEFLQRALHSLADQTFIDWELIVVDDGSPDRVEPLLTEFAERHTLTHVRLQRNTGLGNSLNLARSMARGTFITFLPADDTIHPKHMADLAATLDQSEDIDAAYSGVQMGFRSTSGRESRRFLTLRGDGAVGHELEYARQPHFGGWEDSIKTGNLFALPQLMVRAGGRADLAWTTREEWESDSLEADHWLRALESGAKFVCTGSVTANWTQHPDQRHKIIAGRPNEFGRMAGGLANFRSWYKLSKGEYINWRPSNGYTLDEKEFAAAAIAAVDSTAVSQKTPLRVLFAGDLGFAPESLLLLERNGMCVAGLWMSAPELFMRVGPFPWGNLKDIMFDEGWADEVAQFRPEVIYAGLNWQSIPMIHALLERFPNLPVVFHFKEGPGYLINYGLWGKFQAILRRASTIFFISRENRDWICEQLGEEGNAIRAKAKIMDGDLPLAALVAPPLSADLPKRDGRLHTVCAGRWISTFGWEELAEHNIVVHLYGELFHERAESRISAGVELGVVELHGAVDARDWSTELAQYDAAWSHVSREPGDGSPLDDSWNALNLPARLSTYAAAALPWIMLDSSDGTKSAVQGLAERLGIALSFKSIGELADKLRNEELMTRLRENAQLTRKQFTFDHHFPQLVEALTGAVREASKMGNRSADDGRAM